MLKDVDDNSMIFADLPSEQETPNYNVRLSSSMVPGTLHIAKGAREIGNEALATILNRLCSKQQSTGRATGRSIVFDLEKT